MRSLLSRLERPIPDSYPAIIEALEHSKVDQLAPELEGSKLEPNLLKVCPPKTVLFGCVFNSDEVMETVEHVAGGYSAQRYKTISTYDSGI